MKTEPRADEHAGSRSCTTAVASVGDVIYCKVQDPFPQTLRVVLSTMEACAYGNKLIAAGRWRKGSGCDEN